MTALWALPFAIYAIVQEPSEVKYHLFHLKFFTAPIIATIILNKSSRINDIWTNNHLWSRISIVCGGYAISSIITIILIVSSGGGYYGGDGCGSYALLLFPSIAFYAVIGILGGVVLYLWKMSRETKGRSNTRSDRDRA